MPFKSKAQQRFMFAAEKRGDIPKGTAKRWAEHTPNIKDLPERKKKKSKKKKKSSNGGCDIKEYVVSHDVEVILNGNKYLLEAGDKVNIFDRHRDTDRVFECKGEKKPTQHFYNGPIGNKHYWTCKNCKSTFTYDFGPEESK